MLWNPSLNQVPPTLSWEALSAAISTHDANVMSWILRQDPQLLRGEDGAGRSLLHLTVKAGFEEGVQLLCQHFQASLTVDAVDCDRRTPLHVAAIECLQNEAVLVSIAGMLLDQGANVNAQEIDHWTPLHFAALRSETLSKFLLLHGASPAAKNKVGKTPLHIAVIHNRLPMVQMLSTFAPAQVDILDSASRTALHHAVEDGRTKMTDCLLTAGASPNAQDRNGESPLHLAAKKGLHDICKRLLIARANPNLRDFGHGDTPLHKVGSEFDGIMSLLVEYGGDILMTNKDGVRPLGSVSAELRQSLEDGAISQKKERRPLWLEDKDHPFCRNCQKEFGSLTRRHHCRLCGGIFCGKCSNQKLPLPELGYDEAVRVCNPCFNRIFADRKS